MNKITIEHARKLIERAQAASEPEWHVNGGTIITIDRHRTEAGEAGEGYTRRLVVAGPSVDTYRSEMETAANLKFIAHARNHSEAIAMALIESHEAIQTALEHIIELREAWRTGALSEHDVFGGTRSNRNVEVEVLLRKAIENGNRNMH